MQHTPTEQGYNTDGGYPFNDKPPALYQHSLLQSSLATFTVNGVQYYKFILDTNQSGANAFTLSINQLQIYTSSDPAQMVQTFNPDGTLAFNPTTTHLAYNLNPLNPMGTSLETNSIYTKGIGSGIADMYAYIPVSDFFQTDKYVILYFYAGSDLASTGGFEEWSAATKAAAVPEGSSTLMLSLLGLSALLAGLFFERRTRQVRTSRVADPAVRRE